LNCLWLHTCPVQEYPGAAKAVAAAVRRKYKGMMHYLSVGRDSSQQAILGCVVPSRSLNTVRMATLQYRQVLVSLCGDGSHLRVEKPDLSVCTI
jgi:hypothetical protein